jgi:hypothetical protein
VAAADAQEVGRLAQLEQCAAQALLVLQATRCGWWLFGLKSLEVCVTLRSQSSAVYFLFFVTQPLRKYTVYLTQVPKDVQKSIWILCMCFQIHNLQYRRKSEEILLENYKQIQ